MTGCLSGCRIVVVPEFDAASYAQIEAEVLKSFNRSDIVTPDDVRGNYPTLAEAVLVNSRYVLVPPCSCPCCDPSWPSKCSSAGLLLLFMPCLLPKLESDTSACRLRLASKGKLYVA